MKLRNKAVAALLAVALCIPAAGCSGGDKSWAVKDSAESVPIGAYIYNLFSAYGQADKQKTDSSKSVFDQKIENKDAKTWIREKALTSTKELLLFDKKMKDMNLTLSAAETKNASDMNAQVWGSYASTFEKYGIAQSSFETAYGTALEKERKIFDATYGKNGKQAVSDDDLKNYYTKNYTDFSYIACLLYKPDANGNASSVFTDAQKKSAEAVINGYASQVEAGKMTMQQAADAYKTSLKGTQNELHSDSVNLAADTGYPSDMKNVLKGMKTGEFKTVELKDEQMYLLISKGDAAKSADAKVSSENDRESLLFSYKSDEFLSNLTKEADAMTGVTANDSALNSYDPKMFLSASSAS